MTREEELQVLADFHAHEICKELGGVAAVIELGSLQHPELWTFDSLTGLWVADGAARIRAQLEQRVKSANTVGFQRLVIQHVVNNNFMHLQEFDRIRYLPLKNKVVDLEIGTTLDYAPDLRLTFKLPIVYDPDVRRTAIIKFLKQKLPNQVVRRRFLEAVAAAFVRRMRKRQIHILKGETDTGKTTTLNLLEVLCGRENITRKSLAQLGGEDRFAAADLRNKLANISSELKEQVITNTEVLKNFTGGEGMDAQKKYGHPHKVYPTCEFFAGLNRLPNLDDEDNPDLKNDWAFWSRFDVIPFEHQVKVKDQDQRLVLVEDPEKGKLSNSVEITGFFNILLPLILRIYRTNRTSYNPTPLETRDAFLGVDPVYRFLVETTIKDGRGFVLVADLWDDWEEWRTIPAHEYGYLSPQAFNHKVENYGANRTNSRERRTRRPQQVWVGITLKKNPARMREQRSLDDTVDCRIADEMSSMSFNSPVPSEHRENYSREDSTRKLYDIVDIFQEQKLSLRSWFANLHTAPADPNHQPTCSQTA